MRALLAGADAARAGWADRLRAEGWELQCRRESMGQDASAACAVPDAVLLFAEPGAAMGVCAAARVRWPGAMLWLVCHDAAPALRRSLLTSGAVGVLPPEPTPFHLWRVRCVTADAAARGVSVAGGGSQPVARGRPRGVAGGDPSWPSPAAGWAMPGPVAGVSGSRQVVCSSALPAAGPVGARSPRVGRWGIRAGGSREGPPRGGDPGRWPDEPGERHATPQGERPNWWRWPVPAPPRPGWADLGVVALAPAAALVEEWVRRRGRRVLVLCLRGTPAAPGSHRCAVRPEGWVDLPADSGLAHLRALTATARQAGQGVCLVDPDARTLGGGETDVCGLLAEVTRAVAVVSRPDVDGLVAARAAVDRLLAGLSCAAHAERRVRVWWLRGERPRAGSDVELSAALGVRCVTVGVGRVRRPARR